MRFGLTLGFLVGLTLFLSAGEISPAYAHGNTPEVYAIVPSPEGLPSFVTTYGLVVHVNSEWRWSCSSAMERAPSEQATVVRTSGGDYFGATFGGLRRADSRACGGEIATPALDRIVIDLVAENGVGDNLWALTSDGRDADNGVFRSVDGGETWLPTNEAVSTILFEKIRLAPGNPDVVYLSGAFPRTEAMPERRVFTFLSSDGGANFEAFEFLLGEGERNLFLLGVDPDDEDTVYARVVRAVDSYDLPERLVVSHDGGRSWETLLEVESEISGFAIIDGRIFMSAPQLASFEDRVSGEQVFPKKGLWVSDDGGATFEHLHEDVSMECLGVVDGELWACSFSLGDGPYDVARSADAGRNFEAVFSLDDLVGPTECAGDVAACEVENTDLIRDYGLDICLSPPCSSPGVAGGGCSLFSQQKQGAAMLLFGISFLFLRRRRR